MIKNAIILAAGCGTRLAKYTAQTHKSMLFFKGERIIERQVRLLKEAGMNNIVVVAGYRENEIEFPGVTKIVNNRFADTNMVDSLMRASDYLREGAFVVYGDIVYEMKILDQLLQSSDQALGVVVDTNWKDYWLARYGRLDFDLETLKLKGDEIVEIGKETSNNTEMHGRYVGMLYFPKDVAREAIRLYGNKIRNNETWSASGNQTKKGYMTDLIEEMRSRCHIRAITVNKGWLEFDTEHDYDYFRALPENELSRFISLEN